MPSDTKPLSKVRQYHENSRIRQRENKLFYDDLFINQTYEKDKEKFLMMATYVIHRYKKCYVGREDKELA